MWYIYTTEYYSSIKRSGISSSKKKWKKFKWILLIERSQSEKARHCMILTISHSGEDRTVETAKN